MLKRFADDKSVEKTPSLFLTRERASTSFPEASFALMREMALLGSLGRAATEIIEFVSLRFKLDGSKTEILLAEDT